MKGVNLLTMTQSSSYCSRVAANVAENLRRCLVLHETRRLGYCVTVVELRRINGSLSMSPVLDKFDDMVFVST